ncbi:MAG: O-antigen ligase family protein [Elusimicrobiota bacterium]
MKYFEIIESKDFKSKKLIYILLAFLILFNLAFKSGWDLWVKTLTFILTLTASAVALKDGIIVKIKFNSLLILTVLFSFVSFIFANQPAVKTIAFFKWITYFMIFVLSAAYLKNKRLQAGKMAAYLCIAASLLDILYPHILNTELFPNPNIKAGFFILCSPFLLYIITKKFKQKNYASFFILLLLSTLPLISFINTSSRWGFIVMAALIITWFSMYNKSKKNLLFAIIAAIAFYMLFDFSGMLISAAERLNWITGTVSMILKRPLTGFGPGSVPHILPAFTNSEFLSKMGQAITIIPAQSIQTFTQYTHSYLISLAAEYGLPASLTFTLFLILTIKTLLLSDKKLHKTAGLSFMFVIIHNLLEYNLSIPLISIIFFCLLGTFCVSENYKLKITNTWLKILSATMILSLFAAGANFATAPFISTRYFSMGMYQLSISNAEHANKLFTKSSEIYPDYDLPRLGFAILELNKKRIKKADELIYKSIPAKNLNNPAYETLQKARRYQARGDKQKAMKQYAESISIRFKQFGYMYKIQ